MSPHMLMSKDNQYDKGYEELMDKYEKRGVEIFSLEVKLRHMEKQLERAGEIIKVKETQLKSSGPYG
jgi:DNA-binding sugar fermentation-stimulating protein